MLSIVIVAEKEFAWNRKSRMLIIHKPFSADIIFLDHMMPGFGGVETLKKFVKYATGCIGSFR